MILSTVLPVLTLLSRYARMKETTMMMKVYGATMPRNERIAGTNSVLRKKAV